MSWRETTHERLLQYRSEQEWRDKEKAPANVLELDDPQDRELLSLQYCALRDHLWNNHVASLPSEIRRLLETHEHPSLRWDDPEAAKPYLVQLQHHLETLGRTGEFSLGWFSTPNDCLHVRLCPGVKREELYGHLPQLFMGFRVFYLPD